MPQGQAVDVRERQFVVQLKEYFDQERQQGPTVSTQDAVGRVAQALGLGKRTVKEILRTYRHTGQVAPATLDAKGKPPYRIQGALETVIRQRIRELNRQGSHISVRNLAHWLSEYYEEVPRATLGRALQRMGFVYGQARQRAALRERDEVVIARRAYLRAKRANRHAHGSTVRPEVYLDESYINVNHTTPRTWYFAEDGPWVHKPSGKGPRLIIVHAMTTAGWVPGAQLVFQAKRRTGDYHGQMDFANFRRWFCTSLLPHIPAASLIVMDNAPYHNVYIDGVFYPTTATKKADMQHWLQQHHPTMYQEAMIKAELLAVCRQLCPKPAYELDRLAEAAGHQILRTPQYHPELQPIENCWAVVKNHCAAQCDYTMAGLRGHLEDGFAKVTSATCQAAIAAMREEEDRYWQEDMEEPEE
jgi:transposase